METGHTRGTTPSIQTWNPPTCKSNRSTLWYTPTQRMTNNNNIVWGGTWGWMKWVRVITRRDRSYPTFRITTMNSQSTLVHLPRCKTPVPFSLVLCYSVHHYCACIPTKRWTCNATPCFHSTWVRWPTCTTRMGRVQRRSNTYSQRQIQPQRHMK